MNQPTDIPTRLLDLVRKNHEDPITIRSLAKELRVSRRAALEHCNDLDLNVNVGIRCGGGVARIQSIGDYTVEDLNHVPRTEV